MKSLSLMTFGVQNTIISELNLMIVQCFHTKEKCMSVLQ